MGEYWVLFGVVGKVFPCIGLRGTKLGFGGPVDYPSLSTPKGFLVGFIEVPVEHPLWGRQGSCCQLRSIGFYGAVNAVVFFARHVWVY